MCRTFFDLSRQAALRDFPWSFAIKQILPALVANQPTPEWLYAYQYPADALKIVRFMSLRGNNDTRQSRIPYRIMQPVAAALSPVTGQAAYAQTTGLWIYSNSSGVPIEYVFDNQDVSQWTSDFIVSQAYMLASLIVTTLTSGNPQQQQQAILQMYQTSLANAAAASLNEEQRPEEPQSEFIRGRGGDGYASPGTPWVADPSGFSVQ